MPSKPAHEIIFYSFPTSGHAHRVDLLLRALDLPFKRIDVDLGAKVQKQPDFVAMNPFGQVPVIDDNGTVIWDSTAILMYLALTYGDDTYLPREPKAMAEVVAWLGKASGPIMFGPALARRINVLNNNASKVSSHAIAADLLTVMDSLLMVSTKASAPGRRAIWHRRHGLARHNPAWRKTPAPACCRQAPRYFRA